ncbi:hypothetical protein RIF29_18531 [Crotalaria pallida]|uniref:Ribosomal protein S1 n=1 Tax=Crotalaria pallida TaxID=3830 RepID=A0AAN9FQ40_CROPI
MQLILCPCNCKSLSSFPNYTLPPLSHIIVISNTLKNKLHHHHHHKNQNSFTFTNKDAILSGTHVTFCSINDKFDGFYSNQLSRQALDDRVVHEHETLELLNKPSLVVSFKDEFDMDTKNEDFNGSSNGSVDKNCGVLELHQVAKKVDVEYYEPKSGDFVVGVVVSGNEDKLNVNVGAELLGTMLTKEVLPLYGKEMEHLLCDMNKVEENFMVQGRLGVLENVDVISRETVIGSTVVEIGTILFAEVLGRTLAGRPLLSSRRLFRRIAWHRLRQIKQVNEPIEVRITGWNTGGLLTRIEGLRAFLPKAELMKRVNNFTELKENVSCGPGTFLSEQLFFYFWSTTTKLMSFF